MGAQLATVLISARAVYPPTTILTQANAKPVAHSTPTVWSAVENPNARNASMLTILLRAAFASFALKSSQAVRSAKIVQPAPSALTTDSTWMRGSAYSAQLCPYAYSVQARIHASSAWRTISPTRGTAKSAASIFPNANSATLRHNAERANPAFTLTMTITALPAPYYPTASPVSLPTIARVARTSTE